ncbi:NrtR-regulated NrtX [Saccharospirillum sp. MSK14-1]|uniref:SPFH domain-containing protein n=1 Tax=Saccharospirillum sp. MSK14-1 TaxID=1897632 RepID=UPI000D3BBEA8|nr:SPFH domain-containing protein [Saccharospirillum sp. MSK14-1]PTY38256.1 NrtR-regulated NrtX [Saccharospirillum sp. MSK14-1]
MINVRYFKADASTYVIKSNHGKVVEQGRGLSFFYLEQTTSIAAVPMSAQEAPFVFNMQSADFQDVRVQGQITFRVVDAIKTTEVLNFTLNRSGFGYVSEDPMKLNERVIRVAQSIIQARIQERSLRQVLKDGQATLQLLEQGLDGHKTLAAMGIEVLDVSLTAIRPNTETARALEAEAREAILKEADDAVYLRRISAVEQERTIKEAELQTDYSVQQKEQEIAEQQIENKRRLMLGDMESQREQQLAVIASKKVALEADVANEAERQKLIELSVLNRKQEADAEAYRLKTQMEAMNTLPVETLKALVMGNMNAEQLMAVAMENLSGSVTSIGELNLSPDLLGQVFKKGMRQ